MDPLSSVTSMPGQAQVLMLARMMDAQRTAGAAVIAMLPAAAQATGVPKVSGTGTDLYL